MAVAIDSEEIRKSIKEQLDTIINTVKSALEQIPPELAADIVTRGIFLTGGGALLRRIDQLLREETQLPIHIADNPLLAVAIGSGKALESLDILREITIK
jgi:rod shape-determining protein MreB